MHTPHKDIQTHSLLREAGPGFMTKPELEDCAVGEGWAGNNVYHRLLSSLPIWAILLRWFNMMGNGSFGA